MTKNIFDFTRNSILNGMPAGMLVTKDPVDFDIGYWQNKTYESYVIRDILAKKHCSNTVNILCFDKTTPYENVLKCIVDNDYFVHERKAFHIYTMIFDKETINESIRKELISHKLFVNNFSTEISVETHSIFICDYVKPLLYL